MRSRICELIAAPERCSSVLDAAMPLMPTPHGRCLTLFACLSAGSAASLGGAEPLRSLDPAAVALGSDFADRLEFVHLDDVAQLLGPSWRVGAAVEDICLGPSHRFAQRSTRWMTLESRTCPASNCVGLQTASVEIHVTRAARRRGAAPSLFERGVSAWRSSSAGPSGKTTCILSSALKRPSAIRRAVALAQAITPRDLLGSVPPMFTTSRSGALVHLSGAGSHSHLVERTCRIGARKSLAARRCAGNDPFVAEQQRLGIVSVSAAQLSENGPSRLGEHCGSRAPALPCRCRSGR